LSDWLHRWHERQYKSRKDNTGTNKSGMQDVEDDDDDYKYSYSDCDSEDINEKDSLPKVLLITGPIGVCKSTSKLLHILYMNCGLCTSFMHTLLATIIL